MPDPTPTPEPTPPPTPAPKRHRSDINQTYIAALDRAQTVALQAQKAAHFAVLGPLGVTAAHLTELLAICADGRTAQTAAVLATSDKESETEKEATARRSLTPKMQQLQAWARGKFFFTNPERLNAYHVGEDLNAARTTFLQYAADIRTATQDDALPGATPAFMIAYDAAVAAYVAANAEQAEELEEGMDERVDVKTLAADATHRMMTILFLADGAWPFADPQNRGTRKAFGLPLDRPYAPAPEEEE